MVAGELPKPIHGAFAEIFRINFFKNELVITKPVSHHTRV
jgi:hypothetical protein